MTIWCDFETRSECDLPARGAYNYALDASTRVLCLAWAIDDGEVEIWVPGQEFPKSVADAVVKGDIIRAHNAAFERLIWANVLGPDHGVPTPRLEQFYCTAAQARANCAPGSLEDVGRFAGASMRKDHRGAALVRKCCCPPFTHTEQDLADLYEYCAQDVRTMRAVSLALRPLSDTELADYHVNERINDRGVLIDVALCAAAQRYAAAESAELQAEVRGLLGDQSLRSVKTREWVLERLPDDQRRLTITHKGGEAKDSLDKSVRAALLDLDDLDPDVRVVLQAMDDIWASSTAKFNKLAALADEEDHRLRGAFVFAGGAATGRASSYGAQVHNFPRKAAKDAEAVRAAMLAGQSIAPAYGKRVTDVLKTMLRPSMIPAPGHVFIVADWSAIEGRVHPWLSNCPAGERKLDVFRSGRDPYIVNAAATFHRSYEEILADHEAGRSDQRQIGKVQELACFGPETLVLTQYGFKAILDVRPTDKLWDGESWVTHQGVIFKGQRQTINVCGMEVTPDHLIRTGQTWTQAQTLVSSKRLLTQALETGSVNLPSWVRSELSKAVPMLDTFGFNATAAHRRIWSICTTFLKGRLRDARRALKNRLVFGAKIGTPTPQFALMTGTGAACSTEFRRQSLDAVAKMQSNGALTAAEVSRFTRLGSKTKPRFLRTCSRLMGGTSLKTTWIELMLTRAMSRAICDSFQEGRTEGQTSAPFTKCNNASSNLKPVFDILNSGPRNQFTVLTDAGAMIAHNCGFLGGAGSFATFGRAYGVPFTEAEAVRMVNAWRMANPWAQQHGRALEGAYLRAMRNPGHEVPAGRVTYLYDRTHLWYALPSGRVLCYPFARFDDDGGVSYAKASWKPKADATEWPRGRLWPGLACENVTQAAAHDILRESLRTLEGVVLHIHDEIVLEVPEAAADAARARLVEVMTTAPAWAAGLPLACEAKTMRRYGK